ncbi:protein of unknown function (plasmid) [Pararobbsia alpina]
MLLIENLRAMQRLQAFRFELMPSGEQAQDAPVRGSVPVRL